MCHSFSVFPLDFFSIPNQLLLMENFQNQTKSDKDPPTGPEVYWLMSSTHSSWEPDRSKVKAYARRFLKDFLRYISKDVLLSVSFL